MEKNSEVYQKALKFYDKKEQYLLLVIIKVFEQSLLRFTSIKEVIYDIRPTLFEIINTKQKDILLKKQKGLYYHSKELNVMIDFYFDKYILLLNDALPEDMLLSLYEDTKRNLLAIKKDAHEILKHAEVSIGYIDGFCKSFKSLRELSKKNKDKAFIRSLKNKEHDYAIYRKVRKTLIAESKRIQTLDKQWDSVLMKINVHMEQIRRTYNE